MTTLYSDGAVAQIEDVATLRDFRRRGLAAGDGERGDRRGAREGHELIFIVADDDDWPKDLYARLGFDPIGRAWAFTRPGRSIRRTSDAVGRAVRAAPPRAVARIRRPPA